MSQSENLPPLPVGCSTMAGTTAYTADHMRKYATAAIALHEQRRAQRQQAADAFNADQIRQYQDKERRESGVPPLPEVKP